MFKLKFIFVFVAVVFITCLTFFDTAQSQTQSISGAHYENMSTPPKYIAMLFYKITGQEPPFKEWAEDSKAYENAMELDKTYILNQQITRLTNFFDLLNYQKPIIHEMMVSLSRYSLVNKGFIIHDFHSDQFFSYEAHGKNFAIIPSNLDKFQWVGMPEREYMIFEKGIASPTNNRFVYARIHMTPTHGDASAPITLNRKKHWMMAATVNNIELWSMINEKPHRRLWESNAEWFSKTDNKLLNLYQE